jgi:hypothetical protein
MAKRVKSRPRRAADVVLDAPDTTMLDLLDRLLNKGVVATGDLMLGVAGIDLIYLRLSALLCAVDRVLPRQEPLHSRARHRRPGAKQPR